MKNNNKGITMIALIVTIIVLLILAGISIMMLTDQNGILRRADQAKTETRVAQTDEQVKLSILGALAKGLGTVGYTDLRAELDGTLGAGKYTISPESADATSWTVKVDGKNYKINNTGTFVAIVESGTATTPYFPSSDFSKVEGTSLSNGLVISDTAGNEYVWIEVPTTIYTNATYTAENGNKNPTSGTDYTGIYNILNAYTSAYRSNDSYSDGWYDYFGAIFDEGLTYSKVSYTNSSDLEDFKTKYGTIYSDQALSTVVESPSVDKTYYIKKESINLNDTTGCGLTNSEYTKLYQTMLSSIYENGGFWVGRYEAGIDGTTGDIIAGDTTITDLARSPFSDRINSSSPKAVSQKGAILYNNVHCSEAQKLTSEVNSGNFTSSLMFGIQWDLVCKYLEGKDGLIEENINSDSTDWGNYLKKSFTVQKGKYCLYNMSMRYMESDP